MYLRDCALGKKIIVVKGVDEVANELRKIGNNLNQLTKLVIRHEQELSATLTEQQNAKLQKIKDNHTELMNLGERDAFCRGFSLAVRLMVEAVSSEKT